MHALQLPRLGQTMESGVVSKWLKAAGDSYDVGELLYEVETEKVTIEIEAKRPGTLVRLVAEPGDEVPVGGVLAVVGEPGETPTGGQVDEFIESMGSSSPTESSDVVEDSQPTPGRSEVDSPRGSRSAASPRARVLAKQMGIDLADVTASAADGVISEQDVQAAGLGSVTRRRDLTPTQRAMAATVTRGWSQIPQFSQTIEVDAASLKHRGSDGQSADRSVTNRFVDAILAGVVAVPEANARFNGDHIVIRKDVNVSVAVATERGLVVPVLKSAQRMSPHERTEALVSLITRAREDELAIEDVQGGTIALSNLGTNGIMSGVPLVIPDQIAIVFVGNISERPAVVKGEVQVRPMVHVTAAFDHRVLDGIRGAEFMTALKTNLERQP